MPYPPSDHYNGKRYFNPSAPLAKGLFDVLRWKITTRTVPWTPRPQQSIPAATPPPPSVSGTRGRITFINHSTVLLQYAGMNLITDPIYSERASPFTWIGPRRVAKPGVAFERLPKIDLVLLSHNHYDHLDLPTLKRLAARDKPRIIVPLGVAGLLAQHGMKAEREMDWWDEAGPLTCVPAQHFSARWLNDRNRTLWCGYWLSTPAGPIYFAADTAFGPHFQQIQSRLGSPRIALLPIGAYKPEWFMGPVHMSPTQAVEAHRILAAERSLAIHWGTFPLADDGWQEPVDDLRQALAQHPDSPPFETLENGHYLEF